MSKKLKKTDLSRWQYFSATLFRDPAGKAEFIYAKRRYAKSSELRRCEADNKRLNMTLLLAMFAMVFMGIQYQKVIFFLLFALMFLLGQLVCLTHLPKDITAHLTDNGRCKR